MIWLIPGIIAAVLLSLLFSTLTYSLREVSRVRLGEFLEERGSPQWLEPTMDHLADLIFVTAIGRLVANMLILIGVLIAFDVTGISLVGRYLLAVVVTGVVTLICSVAIPHAAANHFGSALVGYFAAPLNGLRAALHPVTKIMHATEALMSRAGGKGADDEEEEIEQEILSAAQEGEKEGVMDQEERAMIERVIEFDDTHVGQIMTPRPEIVAIAVNSSMEEVRRLVVESGHSRIPVYNGTLDQVIGILYARDLIRQLGLPPEQFEMRKAMRPPLYVPETKPLRDLLKDFRLQKIHIAIVLDEYGGTAGLVTVEDLLEEVVGEMSDEHEAQEPAMLRRINDLSAEADARIYLDELNRIMGLDLPEDAGYDTLGGFISTTLGRIPAVGDAFEHEGARFTVLEAEPQKVNRVKIELPDAAGAKQRADQEKVNAQ
jgi:CBS domain containing-hemolysin-like protein